MCLVCAPRGASEACGLVLLSDGYRTRGTVGASLVWAKPAEFGGYGGATVHTRRDVPADVLLASAMASSHDG